MRAMFAATLIAAILSGCGTPLVWRGPAGTGEQDLADARHECYARSEAWRVHNEQLSQQDVTPMHGVNGDQRLPSNVYNTADKMFQDCMVAQGYRLVPATQ